MNTIIKMCPYCKNSFEVASYRTKQVHCSHGCAARSKHPDIITRFWNNVKKSGPDDCWMWTGVRISNSGYGELRDLCHVKFAHRFSYELANGPIPKGLKILHSCDVKLCVNPAHLRAGTQAENIAESVARGRNKKGENHGASKLLEENIREIRNNLHISNSEYARKFNVSRTNINHIRSRVSWKHVY